MRGTSVRGQGSSLQPEAGGPTGREAAAAKQPGPPEGNEAPDTHELELMTLLVELVRERGRTDAGELLDLDPRTVASALKRRTLSRRVRTALERVSNGQGRQEGEPGALHTQLVARIEGLEREVLAMRELAPERERALRGAFNQDLRQLERRVARLELFVEPEAGALASSEDTEPVVGGPSQRQPGRAGTPRRQYPDLVTREPAPDDAQVYGEAWALVEEWRRLWQVHERPGKGLAWLKREVRILELEVTMPGGARADAAAGDVSPAGTRAAQPPRLAAAGAREQKARACLGATGALAAGRPRVRAPRGRDHIHAGGQREFLVRPLDRAFGARAPVKFRPGCGPGRVRHRDAPPAALVDRALNADQVPAGTLRPLTR